MDAGADRGLDVDANGNTAMRDHGDGDKFLGDDVKLARRMAGAGNVTSLSALARSGIVGAPAVALGRLELAIQAPLPVRTIAQGYPMSASSQDQNRQRFDTIAADWDDSPSRRELAAAVAAAILAAVPVQSAWHAMEYGCGTGLVGAALAPRLGRLLACDVSPGMLSVLEKKAKAAGLDQLQTRVLDLTSEPPPEETFDLIFSSMTMHHIEDVAPLVRTFRCMLKPGGWLALIDLDAEDGSFHGGDVPGVMHRGFDREALQAELRAAGFVETNACTAHTIGKTAADGRVSQYPVFLITARA